jgi:hypothetical protein
LGIVTPKILPKKKFFVPKLLVKLIKKEIIDQAIKVKPIAAIVQQINACVHPKIRPFVPYHSSNNLILPFLHLLAKLSSIIRIGNPKTMIAKM